MNNPRVSVVINTYNRADYLDNALAALAKQRFKNFEVLVVNGPSTDHTTVILEKWRDRIKALGCSERNLSKSRNVGIANASGDIVAFLDDDAIPEPGWLGHIVFTYANPDIAAVGGYILDHTGTTFQCRVTVCNLFGEARNLEHPHEFNPPAQFPPDEYLSPTGANATYRRDILVGVGGFDEEFEYFLDETDVNLRVLKAGGTIAYSPFAFVHHKYAPSDQRNRERIPKTLYRPLRSRAYFMVKHALARHGLSAILDKLYTHIREVRIHNRWYVENGKISRAEFDRLDAELEQGAKDGLRAGFANVRPRYLVAGEGGAKKPATRSFPAGNAPVKPLRLCFLSQEYPPTICGGIGVWTHETATMLARAGHEVTVVTKSASGLDTIDFEAGVWVHRVVPRWQPTRTAPELPDIPQVIKDYAYTVHDEVARIGLSRGLDLVSAPIWDLEGIALVSSGTIPTITSLHTTFKLTLPFKPAWTANEIYHREHVLKVIDGESYLLMNSRYVLANSAAVIRDIGKNYGIELPADRATVIPHFLDDVRVDGGAATSDNSLTCLFVGRFEKRKGIDTVLEAAAEVLRRHANVRFVLAGCNDLTEDGKNYLREFLEDDSHRDFLHRISAPGVVSNEELLRLYASCDVFLAPSRYESFGLIFLEAMRFGKPCIGTEVGGIPEVVQHGTNGILIAPGSSAELTGALGRLAGDAALRREMGAASRRIFKEKFSSEKAAGQFEHYYRSVIAASQQMNSVERRYRHVA